MLYCFPRDIYKKWSPVYIGGTENDGPSKLQDMKLQDTTNISLLLFPTNPSNFSSIVENLM